MGPGSRVLRKAKSFRDELKTKITRRATSVPRQDGVPVSPNRQRHSRVRPLSNNTSDTEAALATKQRRGKTAYVRYQWPSTDEGSNKTSGEAAAAVKRKSLSRGMSFHEGKKTDRFDQVR